MFVTPPPPEHMFCRFLSAVPRPVMRRAFFLLRPWLLLTAALAIAVGPQTPPVPVHAQSTTAGSLDVSFGGDGIVTSSVSSAQSKINALAVQSDGKIVAAGSSLAGSDLDLTLVRYNSDGTLDTTFGDGDGKVTTDFGNEDTAYAVEVLSDGKILAAGYTGSAANFDFALARYTADGVLDTDFGTDGKVTTAIGSGHDEIRAMAVLSDGKILVAGNSHNGTNRDFILARYTAAGALDTTFGSGTGQIKNGWVLTPIGSDDDSATSLAVHTDGKIVVGGSTKVSGNNRDFAIARYTSAGVLDTTFDSDGKVTTDFASGNSNDRIHGVAVLSDGKVLAGGYSSHPAPRFTDFTLARYTAGGALDTTFGSGSPKTGYDVSMRTRSDTGLAMLLQGDGTVLIGGYVYTGTGNDYDFAVGRFTAAGVLDTTFGTSGVATTPIGSDNDEASALAVQSDGKIVLAGFGHNGTHEDFALTRYSSAGVLDTSFGSSGVVTTAAGSGTDYGYGVALQSDGKLVMVGDVTTGSAIDFGLTRYNSDGTVDTGFGKDGRVTTDFNSGASDHGEAVAVQSDGKIVAAGRSNKGTAKDFAVARYNSDGSLDTGFGTGGKVTTDFSSGEDRPYAVAVHTDGTIVVVGYAHNGTSNAFAIARYTSMGVPDTSFDSDGKVTTDFGTSNDRARAVAIQSDGKIVVGGGAKGDFTVARYDTDGSLDTSFGGDADGNNVKDGYVTTTMSSADDTALAVAFQSDGKIVAAGAAVISGDYDFAVARYSADGALDTDFGTVSGSTRTGWVTTPMSDHRDIAYGLLLQGGGRIVLAGWAGNTAGGAARPLDFALVRYTEDGDLDTDFGTGGKVTTPIGPGDDRAYGAVLQDDGKIVAAGFAHSGKTYEFALARYHAPTANTVSLSVSPSSRVDEGLPVTVTARLSTALEQRVTIRLTVTDGTAESNDYRSPRSISIAAGETSGTGIITTAQDADTEDETFTVALGDPPSPLEKGSPALVTVTILDDDYPTTVTLTASSTRPAEGSTVTLTARLNLPAPTGGVRVRFQTTGGTAAAGHVDDTDRTLIDYTLEPKTSNPATAGITAYIELDPGRTAAVGTLTVEDDTVGEGNETIELSVVAHLRNRLTNLTDNITLTIPANDGGVPDPDPTPTPPPGPPDPPGPPPTDNGGGGGFAPVSVPEFSEGPRAARAVPENAGPGDPVGDPVTATHPDGEAVTYAIRNPDESIFAVDPDTGQLTVKEGVELAEGDTYTVTLIARSATGALAFIDVVVTVGERMYHAYDRNRNGVIELEEAVAAAQDYFAGKLSLEEALEIIRLYFAG